LQKRNTKKLHMKSLWDKIKKYGFIGILEYFSHNIVKTYWQNIHYLKTEIDYDKIKTDLKQLELDAKELGYEDFLLGNPNEFTPRKLKLIKERFESSTFKCYGYINNETLAYSTWISLHNIELPLISKKYILSEDEGFLEDSYSHPSYRGRGYHSKFNLYRMSKIYELGKKYCLVFVVDGNIPAMKVQQKCGFYDVGCFKVGKIFGIPFTTFNKTKLDKLFETHKNQINEKI